MAKGIEKRTTVVVEKVATSVKEPIHATQKSFQEGNIQINGRMSREQFDKAFMGKISVDINGLWNRYQNWLSKNK